MIQREIQSSISDATQQFPAVGILGLRQILLVVKYQKNSPSE